MPRVRPSKALRAALATLAGALLLAACSSGIRYLRPRPVPPSDGRPNIVFVLTDDLSMNLVPFMPHIQALMHEGMTFRNYFVVDSLCCPSRSAIFTGQYPHNNGVFTNHGPQGGYHAYNRFGNPPKSFAVALQKSGYYTGFMGKYLNEYQPSDPAAPGWDEWDVAGNAYGEFNYGLNENGDLHNYGHDPEDYLTDVLSDKASDFIAASRYTGKPFALEIATFAPHGPYVPAPQDVNTYPNLTAPRGPAFDRHPSGAPPWLADVPPLSADDLDKIDTAFRLRVEAVQSVDRMIGRLERKLAREHRLDNTYFVFSSDNGYHMGEYGLQPGKQTAFDTDIRVPLVITGPGVPAGRETSAITSSIDLAPTFLAIAGTQPTDKPDGVSLLPLLRGKSPPADWQRAALVEHRARSVQSQGPDKQPVQAGRPPSYEAMRTDRWLYVEYVTGEREYYDLTSDPFEMHNIAGRLGTERLALLHRMLGELERCKGASECQQAASLRYAAPERR
jgi:N-acetylglucosamine-6-sulfatase